MRHRLKSRRGQSGSKSLSAQRFALLAVATILAALIIACTPPLVHESPPHFYALNLPLVASPADADGKLVAGVFRSVRLLLDDRAMARTQTIIGETKLGQLLEPGHRLGMTFTSPRTFYGIAVSLSRVGPGPTSVHVTLRRHGRTGSIIAARDLPDLAQHGWAELRTESEPTGTYYVELSNVTGQGVYWRGNDLGPGTDMWSGYQAHAVPFSLPATLANFPIYDNGSLSILVNAQVERLYILGGRSSYDEGVSPWGDYEARGDTTDRQLIGDKDGELEVIYTDGTKDVVPLMFGLNQWWWQHWGDTTSGGPYTEPFATTPRQLIASLHVYSLGDVPLAPSFWVYQPQKKVIARLRFVDNPQIQGFPLLAAVTVEARQGGPNAALLQPPADAGSLDRWLEANTITPAMVATALYERDIAALRDALYSRPATLPTTPTPVAIAGRRGPTLRFEGTAAAAVLSNVYEQSLADLRAKLDGGGRFHTSTEKAPNFGLYGGIGTWRADVGYFYNQAWARDMGRSLLELIRLGFLDQVEAGLQFAASHLYDLTNAFPHFSRNGQRVPPHWTTVLDEPDYSDIDGMGDGNQENDGHGLLLLAFVRTWHERGRPLDWLQHYWQTIRDASEWYCFQLETPSFSRATTVLYTEGEAANSGGYDVYSNQIAVEALQGTVQMARAMGETAAAARWAGCAARIGRGMAAELTDNDVRYGQTWRAVAWDWDYGHESLAPSFMSPDLYGYSLAASDTLTITSQTYRRQVEQLSGFKSARFLGYGQAFLTQAALMLDDMMGAGEALQNIASFIYDADIGPYLPPEGVALHPSGAYWYRTGDLGNAMQEAEVLKSLSLLAGVDDLDGERLTIIPRLPVRWTGISVADYPVTVAGQRLTISYTLKAESQALHLQLIADKPIPLLSIRLGPVPLDADPKVTIDGVPVAAQVAGSGNADWLWLRDLTGKQSVQIEMTW